MSQHNELAAISESQLDQLRQLARANNAITLWQSIEGEALEGQITCARRVMNPYGAEQAQLLVRTPSGDTVAVWLSPWLEKAIKGQGGKVGSLISLTFCGRETSKLGRPFNRYEVTVL
jgi:hypothetical protein